MDKLLALLSGYLQQASATIHHYGPAIWQTTLALIQWVSIWNLALGGIALVVFAVCLTCLIMAVERDAFGRDFTRWSLIALLSILFGVLCLIVGLCNVLDIHNWLGAFAPQLEILYRVAEKAGLM